jgi:hypothetical protein
MCNIPKKKTFIRLSIANSVIYYFSQTKLSIRYFFFFFFFFFFMLLSLSELKPLPLQLPPRRKRNVAPTRPRKSVLQLRQDLGRVDWSKNFPKNPPIVFSQSLNFLSSAHDIPWSSFFFFPFVSLMPMMILWLS